MAQLMESEEGYTRFTKAYTHAKSRLEKNEYNWRQAFEEASKITCHRLPTPAEKGTIAAYAIHMLDLESNFHFGWIDSLRVPLEKLSKIGVIDSSEVQQCFDNLIKRQYLLKSEHRGQYCSAIHSRNAADINSLYEALLRN